MLQNAKVLVVDDEASITNIISRTLSGAKITAHIASSGAEAVEFLEENPVDAVITDILMPGMNGLDLTGKIKIMCPDLPVIVLTSQGNYYVAMEALNRGAFYFLTKPFSRDSILNTVYKALSLPRLTSERSSIVPYSAQLLKYDIPSDINLISGINYHVSRAAGDMQFPQRAVKFSIPLAVDELVINAIKHGNGNNVDKRVKIEVEITEAYISFFVEDEGDGFDPEAIPTELTEENVLKTSGRGIMMVRYYMDELTFEKNGTRAVCTHQKASQKA